MNTQKLRDLDEERQLVLQCLSDLNKRLKEIESKFNIKEEDWRLWHKLLEVIVLK